MKAEQLVARYGMCAHVENGAFVERHYPHAGEGRAASGSIYYYIAPGERTRFHRIDCDEYWSYNCGASAEVWIIDAEGRLSVRGLGVEEGCDPLIYLPKGMIFAARLRTDAQEGAFISCITVPRFTYAGFEMLEKDAVAALCPAAAAFWK